MSPVEWAPSLWKYSIIPTEELLLVMTDSSFCKAVQVQFEAPTDHFVSL